MSSISCLLCTFPLPLPAPSLRLSCRVAAHMRPAVTWDDGISPFSYGLVEKILGGLKQRNGCPIPSTYYICVSGAPTLPLAYGAGCVAWAGWKGRARILLLHAGQIVPPCSSPAAADTIPAAVQALYMAGNEIGEQLNACSTWNACPVGRHGLDLSGPCHAHVLS